VPGGRARWGWYRLADGQAERIVRSAGVGPGDLVLDVGAGDGAFTRPLVAAGARVLAFELHPGRAGDLEARFADDPVSVVRASVADLRLPSRPFRVVANPPFAHGSALVRALTRRGSRLVQADLVLPVQVAQRWQGRVGRAHRARLVHRLPRHAFRPAAPVPTAVLRIRRARRP
jgi:23S rRNA (adenine-N6)-dimethyltransferase